MRPVGTSPLTPGTMKAPLLILGLAAALTIGAQTVTAGHRSAVYGPANTLLAQRSLSADEAAALVQARTGGRVLSVDTVRRRDRLFYRVKVLTPQGEVRIFMVDAESGAF